MIEQTKTLPVTRKAAFAFFTDVGRWGEWTPFGVRERDVTFAEPGDEVSVGYRSLPIPPGVKVILQDLLPDKAIDVRFRAPGTIPIDLHLEFHGTGTRAVLVRATVDFRVPGGQLARSLWRMSMVPVLVRRELRHALDAAHDLLAAPVIEEKAGK